MRTSSDFAIRVDSVSKRYDLSADGGRGYQTFREAVVDVAKAPLRRMRGERAKNSNREFWALRDVNVSVSPGEVVGVIGRNGAGKSTFLKILSRITRPSGGEVVLRGRVGSLLEVGTGFHPELSGRENIFLNGAILGMSRAEIRSKFDQIVDFAEVEKFLDTPVKRYSSGMYVRLAFAVAAHLEPEILLVDEVLAVGDAAFQRKCLGKMGEVSRQGRTILFVSHNMGAITRLCQRALWLDHGTVRGIGPVEEMVGEYLAAGVADSGEMIFDPSDPRAPGSDYVRPLAVRIRNSLGRAAATVDIRHPLAIEIEYEILRPVPDLRIGFTLIAHDGTVVFNPKDTDDEDSTRDRMPGRFVTRCTLPGDFLNCGHYFVSIGADSPMVQTHFLIDQAVSFRVEQTGGIGGHVADGRAGLLRMRLPWSVTRIDQSDFESIAREMSEMR